MARLKTSAGLLPFRRVPTEGIQVLVAHMGGPFWAKKDAHAWSIVKGEYDPQAEDPLQVALREWTEETGQPVPAGALIELGEVKQSGGKRVTAWAVEAPELDPSGFVSDTFTLEWPPRSGRQQEFPEIDRAEWVELAVARERLVRGQLPLLDALQTALGG